MDTRVLTAAQAAGYLACSVQHLYRYARVGIIPCYNIGGGVRNWGSDYRFRICDLDKFILSRRIDKATYYWTSEDKELPREIVARLLGLTEAGVKFRQRSERSRRGPVRVVLKDRTPESIRRCIEVAYHLKMEAQIRKEMHGKLAAARAEALTYRQKYEALLQKVNDA